MGETYYVNIGENAPPLAYQQSPPYWNQQPITFYPNQNSNPTPPQRFPPLPLHSQNQNYIGTFPSNFLPPPQSGPNPDLVSVFPQQPLQMVYPQNPVLYPNQQNVVFTQNPVYPPQVFPQNVPSYPQNTSTPNSCTSSVSHTTFSNHVQVIVCQKNEKKIITMTTFRSKTIIKTWFNWLKTWHKWALYKELRPLAAKIFKTSGRKLVLPRPTVTSSILLKISYWVRVRAVPVRTRRQPL